MAGIRFAACATTTLDPMLEARQPRPRFGCWGKQDDRSWWLAKAPLTLDNVDGRCSRAPLRVPADRGPQARWQRQVAGNERCRGLDGHLSAYALLRSFQRAFR